MCLFMYVLLCCIVIVMISIIFIIVYIYIYICIPGSQRDGRERATGAMVAAARTSIIII